MTTTDTTGVVFSEVTNENEYTIEYGLYMMLPVISDTWMMMTAPFDVANIYVLETTKEQPKSPRTDVWTTDDYHKFFQRQGAADGDMAQTLVTSVLPDIFSGRGSGVLKPLPYILNNMTNDDTKLTKITHYDGTLASMYSANYYLNVQKPDVAEHLWNKETDEKNYGNKWEIAPAQSTPNFLTRRISNPDCDVYDDDCVDIEVKEPYVDQDGNEQAQQWVVMQRDKVYSMFFPGGSNRWWDYKYLIFEGYGPQRLSGSNAHSTFVVPTTYSDDEHIVLQGNSTFANVQVAANSTHPLFYPKKTVTGSYPTGNITYSFEAVTTSQRVLPTDVYMVSSNNSSTKAQMPALHHGIDSTTALEESNVPTLAPVSLEAWTDGGYINLRAYQEQHVSIFSTTGTLLWQGTLSANTDTTIPASAGVYIIQGEETTIKIIN